MINNYFTLRALVNEIGDTVVSSNIEACYTRAEHTLEIILGKAGTQPKVIIVSCKPRANYIFMRAAPRRHNGANVLHDAVGLTIVAADVIENERTVLLRLSTDKSLVINLFGPHANVYFTDAAGHAWNSFLKKSKIGVTILPEELRKWEVDVRRFCAAFGSAEGSPARRLAALMPSFGGELGKEAFFRAGGEDLLRTSRSGDVVMDEREAALLHNQISGMLDELSLPKPRIYYDGDNPVMMSLITMEHLGNLREEMYSSVNLCAAAYSVNAERRKGDADVKNALVNRLVKRKEELSKTIAKIEADMSGDREARYRRIGDVLMSNLGKTEKGADSFTDESSGEKIALDPKLTDVRNAQTYYEKAKKARESHRQAVGRKEELKKALTEAEAELVKLQNGVGTDNIHTILKKERAKENAQTPFREFETNGYKVYVGKDAKNNDQLTFGFAKPNDVFLHARGVSGSHVIIRNGSREYPQKVVLEYAARIAAHYSKARTSGIVPVAYTMRKFVKKAKGQPGAVFMDREEVIFVEPGIPQQITPKFPTIQ